MIGNIIASALERNMPTYEQSMRAYGETITKGVVEALSERYGFDAQEARDYLGVANDDQMGAGPDAGLRNGARKRSKRPPKVSRAVPASHLDMDGDTSVDINGDTGLDDHPAFYGGGIVTTEGKGAIVLQTLRERDLSHDSVLEDAAFMKTQIKFAG